jgi:hypothetical protein
MDKILKMEILKMDKILNIIHKKHCVLGQDWTGQKIWKFSPSGQDRTDTCPRTGLVKTRQKILKFACLRTGQKFPNLVPTPDFSNLRKKS